MWNSPDKLAAEVEADVRAGWFGQTFDLAGTAKGHQVMAGRDFFGKIVLRVP